MSQSQNPQQLVAVLALGIDDFTGISHGLEHETSNHLLRAVAQRLTNCMAKTDILAHWSQDEFAIAQMDILSFEMYGFLSLGSNQMTVTHLDFTLIGTGFRTETVLVVQVAFVQLLLET